jgi:hypothetical protein
VTVSTMPERKDGIGTGSPEMSVGMLPAAKIYLLSAAVFALNH